MVSSARSLRKIGYTLAEGVHLAQVIFEKKLPVRSLIVCEELLTDEARNSLSNLQTQSEKCFFLPKSLYDEISPVENGVGLISEIPIQSHSLDQTKYAEDALYLDGVQDMGNVGTLIRTAVAAGVRKIVTSPKTACVWAPKVVRAAMGAHFGATIFENVTAETLKESFEARFLAADARGGKDLFFESDWHRGHTVWLMGAEGPGLSDEALSISDERYLIPIEKDCESLNVAAAAAICLFEQRRRRKIG